MIKAVIFDYQAASGANISFVAVLTGIFKR
ncbi:MAG: hypothetical protein UT66_C0024G0013 [candidate division CPR2 bacterium GW2011_GWC1_39_9]|uniref:Uncharacterized protein n=1 Tax=candidate division CPR2 bacterium GW2011_GWC2_39_10 TaxID=1618345 RepID=A0A0G0PWL9_UNCC2|nr:MAG: hypothetical protein UT18_C0016G0037 [candidate division CPR2 bacterium GW2011_GWC2_39_10]KKR34429.1 MAG: hypothetical protein UT66_C0024G0013 [candidate division CPR2 bacterium GW2011_GWC1_39_9]